MKRNNRDRKMMKRILLKLNDFLADDQLDLRQFDRMMLRLKKRYHPKLGVIDFKYFDEIRLAKARREKRRGEQIQNFQYARSQRNLELVCREYIELRKLFNLEKSRFLFEGNYILYCHCGTSKNDTIILQYILHDENYIKLNIKA